VERWKSERLSYRPYGPEDTAALIDFYSRPETFEFLSANAAIRDAAAADAFLKLVHERHGHYGALPYGYWAATTPIDGVEKVVATAILKPAPDAERKPTEDIEVGWHVHPDHWRQGYAKEMARALLDRGFQRTDRPILHAVINVANGASRSVARHAGMHHIGSTDRYYGMPFEHYVIDRATWERRAVRRTFSVAIFARHEGRILLAKHKRLQTWLPVGGEVESNETPLEAARRELFEETGLEGRFEVRDQLEGAPPGLLGYEEHLAGKKGLHLNFCFLCDVPSREVKLDDSLSAHRWVSIEDGPWDEAPNNVRQLVERALGGGGPR
jgi:8-oxo-dGTP diphosphatase